ncbi:MAG: adenosylcobinamide-GDP ribazoletransferase [Oscillibacter sp.]|nr:adenosylcobinamide-GDP ribazoletransferase [Oscillibacter sp.]
MQILETIAAAFSMFSAIPMPRTTTARHMLCAFPLVGAAIGLCCAAWGVLCDCLTLPAILRGAGWTLIPVALTGGIHLDGYADTSDALGSHAPPERRREILTDPRCGAFAVIRLCAYFVGYFALCASLDSYGPMCAAFVLSRSLSGAALTLLPISDASSLARAFVQTPDASRVRVILCAESCAAALALWILGGASGLLMTCAAAAVMWRYAVVARRDFGGASGDLAGWFLQKVELWMLAALVFAQYAR